MADTLQKVHLPIVSDEGDFSGVSKSYQNWKFQDVTKNLVVLVLPAMLDINDPRNNNPDISRLRVSVRGGHCCSINGLRRLARGGERFLSGFSNDLQ